MFSTPLGSIWVKSEWLVSKYQVYNKNWNISVQYKISNLVCYVCVTICRRGLCKIWKNCSWAFFSIWTCFWALKHSYKWIRVENKISWFYLLTLFCMTFFWENQKFWKNFTKMAITPQIMVSDMQMRGVLGSWDPPLHIWVFKRRAGGPWRAPAVNAARRSLRGRWIASRS